MAWTTQNIQLPPGNMSYMHSYTNQGSIFSERSTVDHPVGVICRGSVRHVAIFFPSSGGWELLGLLGLQSRLGDKLLEM